MLFLEFSFFSLIIFFCVRLKIRRLKEHVLVELPPKRRQIIRLLLKRSDIVSAKAALGMVNGDACETNAADDTNPESLDESDGKLLISIPCHL